MKGCIIGKEIIEQPLTEAEEKMINDFFLQQEGKMVTLKKSETIDKD